MSMGLTAEQVQRKYGISREDQDAFSLRSHQNALRAQAEGRFDDEMVPVEVETTTLNGGKPHVGEDHVYRKTKARARTPRWRRWPS